MGWRILVNFMLKLKTHSGFHDFFLNLYHILEMKFLVRTLLYLSRKMVCSWMFIESLLILFCDSRDLPLFHHQTMVYYGVDDLSMCLKLFCQL
jgi:hypothetical protein